MDLVLPSKLGAGRSGRRDDNMERCGGHSFWLLSFLKAHISSHGSWLYLNFTASHRTQQWAFLTIVNSHNSGFTLHGFRRGQTIFLSSNCIIFSLEWQERQWICNHGQYRVCYSFIHESFFFFLSNLCLWKRVSCLVNHTLVLNAWRLAGGVCCDRGRWSKQWPWEECGCLGLSWFGYFRNYIFYIVNWILINIGFSC